MKEEDVDLQALVEAAAETPDQTVDEAEKIAEELREQQEINERVEKLMDDESIPLSFKTIVGGDILRSKFVLRQIFFILFCAALMILHTWNRYASQDDQIEIDQLRKDLLDVKYNVLTQSSELMNLMRQSNVEQILKQTPDSMLTNSVSAPFLLKPQVKSE